MTEAAEFCPVPIPTSTGLVGMAHAPHDWRLLSRVYRPMFVETVASIPGTTVMHAHGQMMNTEPEGWEYVWYCTRCRAVDVQKGQPE